MIFFSCYVFAQNSFTRNSQVTTLALSSQISAIVTNPQLKMPGTNWRVAQGPFQITGRVIGGDAVGVEGGGWKTQLPPGSRHRIVYKIMEIMKRYHPFSRQENLQDLEKTAVAFEENIFTAATSQSHYLRKISLKMLSLEMNPILNSLQSNAASNSRNPVPVEAAGTEGSDWRVGLQRSSRQRIANKIMEILRRHLPFSGEDGLEEEIKIMAVRFEENVYSAAFNQSDYLRKISLKMLTLATKIPEVFSEFSSV